MKIGNRTNKHYAVKLTREELDLIGAMTKVFVRTGPPTAEILPTIHIAKCMSEEIYQALSKDPMWNVATRASKKEIEYEKRENR